MQRRTLLLGIAATAALPALGNPPRHWRTMSKRRFGPTLLYNPPNLTARLPVFDDVPEFTTVGLKLYGGPLRLRRIEYIYAGGARESHRLDVAVASNEIARLPVPAARLVAVDVVSDRYSDGHRYWHLVGSA